MIITQLSTSYISDQWLIPTDNDFKFNDISTHGSHFCQICGESRLSIYWEWIHLKWKQEVSISSASWLPIASRNQNMIIMYRWMDRERDNMKNSIPHQSPTPKHSLKRVNVSSFSSGATFKGKNLLQLCYLLEQMFSLNGCPHFWKLSNIGEATSHLH